MFNLKSNIYDDFDLREGSILIAEPFLDEIYFSRSCILMAKMEVDKPSIGFVLNKETDFYLDELISGVFSDKKFPVFCGGPLSLDRLFYVHDIANLPDAIPIANGLFLNGNLDSVIDYINSSPDCDKHIKFFVGYSGWDPGQLKEELNMNTWAVLPEIDNAFTLSNNTDDLWEQAVRLLGEDFTNWLLFPTEPLLN